MNEVTLAHSVSSPDIRVLRGKFDSVPFSPYHVLVILVLALVGFIEGYDLAVTGSLSVLAKQPLHLRPADIQWHVAGPSLFSCCGGFMASAISDHLPRKTILQIGVISVTGLTLLIPLVQNAEQLFALRILIGFGRRICGRGAVPDHGRTDVGAAPPHLFRDLRNRAGELVYRAAVDGGRARHRFFARPLRAAILLGAVPPRPASLDGNRSLDVRHRPGRGVDELWHRNPRLHGDDPRQGLHRLSDGDHRAALGRFFTLSSAPFPASC
jgi:hypothetical protein